MSRKGKAPIALPKGAEVKIIQDEVVVKGPRGELRQKLLPCIDVTVTKDEVVVSLKEENPENSKFHGLYRSLIFNMIHGTTQGFEKRLQMIGVGYRAATQGSELDVQVGYSHPTKLTIPKGLEVKVDKTTTVIILGSDKQQVGQFAAVIRSLRPPEPYKGKGIRYENEYVRRKAGKAASAGKK